MNYKANIVMIGPTYPDRRRMSYSLNEYEALCKKAPWQWDALGPSRRSG